MSGFAKYAAAQLEAWVPTGKNDPRVDPNGNRIPEMMKLRYPHGTSGGLGQEYLEPWARQEERDYYAELAESMGVDPDSAEAQLPKRRRRAPVETAPVADEGLEPDPDFADPW